MVLLLEILLSLVGQTQVLLLKTTKFNDSGTSPKDSTKFSGLGLSYEDSTKLENS